MSLRRVLMAIVLIDRVRRRRFGASDSSRWIYAARRHAVDQGRGDDFPDYTYTLNPKTPDADGNAIHLESVQRQPRLPQHHRQHLAPGRVPHHAGHLARNRTPRSSLNGSLVFRIKYAYAQFNLDDWMTRGSYARFGIQQTPWLDFAEGIYRYRFQGTMFAEREGYFASADAGASFHYNFPSNYGDVHVGVYNGENYNKAEANDQKALMIRATRAAVRRRAIRCCAGFRATVFYDADDYVKNAPRNRVHRRPQLRAPVRQRRLRVPRHQRSDVGDQGSRSRRPRLLDLGHAEVDDGHRGAAALRPPDAEHRARRPRPQPDDSRRRLLVPASGQRVERASCSTTTVRPSTTSRRRSRSNRGSPCTGSSASRGVTP